MAVSHPEDMPDPQLIHRHCGGWLAKAPAGSRFKIAVIADDPATAASEWHAAVAELARVVDEPVNREHGGVVCLSPA